MGKGKIILGLAVAAYAVFAGWQFAALKLDNAEFHDELRDIAEQRGANIGLVTPKTDDEVRAQVLRAAAEHGFDVRPEDITLERIVTNRFYVHFNIKVEYTAHVNILVHTFDQRFTVTNAPSQ